MTVERIGDKRIALYISGDELDSLIPDDGQFNLQTAQELAEKAFSHWGEGISGSLELEAFAGSGGVLLFARLIDNEVFAYTYDSFEHILQASRLLHGSPPQAELYTYNQYYMVLSDTELPDSFSEYAAVNTLEATAAAMIREHGWLLSSDIYAEIL